MYSIASITATTTKLPPDKKFALVHKRCYSWNYHSEDKQYNDNCRHGLSAFFIVKIKHFYSSGKCLFERILYMKFPFFASFIVFCLWLGYELHKARNRENKNSESFWNRELQANSTRRKSLDDLDYIRIPFETLPMDILADDPIISECHETLKTLSQSPIVNFTGISNTDLKLMYGAPNIDLLSRYDQSYTTLVLTLQRWAQALYDNDRTEEARRVLEFAVQTRSDISATYKLLATIYQQSGMSEKITDLIPIARDLNTRLSGHIVSTLEKMLP